MKCCEANSSGGKCAFSTTVLQGEAAGSARWGARRQGPREVLGAVIHPGQALESLDRGRLRDGRPSLETRWSAGHSSQVSGVPSQRCVCLFLLYFNYKTNICPLQ